MEKPKQKYSLFAFQQSTILDSDIPSKCHQKSFLMEKKKRWKLWQWVFSKFYFFNRKGRKVLRKGRNEFNIFKNWHTDKTDRTDYHGYFKLMSKKSV